MATLNNVEEFFKNIVGEAEDKLSGRPPADNPDDESHEDEPDREGSDTPDVTPPPTEDTASPVAVDEPGTPAASPVTFTEFNYLSIGGHTGRIRATGSIGSKPFSVTEAAGPHANLDDLSAFIHKIITDNV